MVRFTAYSVALVLALAIWLAWPRAGSAFTIGTAAPDIAGVNWINSQPLTIASLKGRVVLVEFWTYG
jgi:hypothetical protein